MAEKTADRIRALRQQMAKRGIDAYLVVSEDYHASEYVGDYFKCREFLSGFDGSAGTLLVTAEEAGLWTDGRYFIQAKEQLAGSGIRLWRSGESGVPDLVDYLVEVMKPGQCLGYDGRTVSIRYAAELKERLAGQKLCYQEHVDLVDILWQERPAFPANPIWELEEKYAGRSRREKLQQIRECMREKMADLHILASLDDIAWLFNIRGNDIRYNPVALSYALLQQEEAVLYIAPEAVSTQIAEALREDGVEQRPYWQLYEDLPELAAGKRVLLDQSSVNVALLSGIPEDAELLYQPNPSQSAKSRKNAVEMENIRQAHLQDGTAVTKLLCWLEQEAQQEAIRQGELTELDVAGQIERYRRECQDYLGASFASIIASGAHGAIVHYEPTEESNAPVRPDSFLLMDMGAQYLQGTTDITRTIATGRLSRQQQEHYTAVLRGNLRLADAYFKYGYTGCHLDYLAREPLWRLGLDYNHGTGHGVGYLLNVHEGPQGIRRKESGEQIGVMLEEGMLTSDEPGVYLEGQYGIRLENLLLCRQAEKTEMGQFMCFETVTLAPFDRRAILPECMTERELQLLNAYHAEVNRKLSPYLSAGEREWLKQACAPM